MDETRNGTVRVPGAQLHYETRGSGPLLLILQGGDGDAGLTEDLVGRLSAHHRVVTYDRRGVSRSTLDDGDTRPWSLGLHADDVHRLLAELTGEPAIVLGSSIGALIGLDLAARHPEQVGVLVAHEPPAMRLLPEPECAQALTFLSEAVLTYEEHGVGPAMMKMLAFNGIDPGRMETEPGVAMPEPNPHRMANAALFLSRDLPAVRDYEPDVPALRTAAPVIVPALGQASAGLATHRCTQLLAETIDRQVVEFPGGHNGMMTHPVAFSSRLRETLDAHVRL
ncbi:alpha/beta hydrolase [Nonomuraea sp. NN258]|uniref:alpha/beta fold hydrolase n=1 Tax=Nonomuraea antri TaxID=2730852 RepID=UPI001568E02E|nr:alpha/beta hydrolase [Nonomuraea antri]NRQ37579.1 alpha/beta hydrolase [Nonomuraea antri]